MEENKLDKKRIAIISSALIFTIIASVIIFIMGKAVERYDESSKLYYYPIGIDMEGDNINLNQKDRQELDKIIENLNLTETKTVLNDITYKIEIDNDIYLIGKTNVISKNNKTYNVDNLNSLLNFIKSKVKEVSIIKLYIIENYEYKEIELSKEVKENIKSFWSNQIKYINYIDLAQLTKYVLVIGDDIITTDEEHYYATFKDGYIILNNNIGDILDSYNDNLYSINNNISSYSSQYETRGVYQEINNQDGKSCVYVVAMGIQMTGGYSISIDSVDIDSDDVTVYIKEKTPKPTDIVTQALTYPICTISFKTEPKTIKFVDENDNELAFITK